MPLMFQWVGDINAGFPSAAEGYEDQPLDLYELIPNPAATFFFRVEGDDLRHEHLRDGSYLIVDRSITPQRGRLVLVEEDGQFVVCRFRVDRPSVVCGVVTAAIHRF
jgi:DNA polymerase V